MGFFCFRHLPSTRLPSAGPLPWAFAASDLLSPDSDRCSSGGEEGEEGSNKEISEPTAAQAGPSFSLPGMALPRPLLRPLRLLAAGRLSIRVSPESQPPSSPPVLANGEPIGGRLPQGTGAFFPLRSPKKPPKCHWRGFAASSPAMMAVWGPSVARELTPPAFDSPLPLQ